MSSAVVPSLYDAIINEVVNQSRTDFQDDGIDEATLQEFKNIWAQKIAAASAPDIRPISPLPENNIKAESEAAVPFQGGGNALAAMRAAQQLQQLQARSNGNIAQSHADTAVAHLMQQAQQAGGGGGAPSFNTESLQKTESPNGDGVPTEVKQEPDLPISVNPADMMLPQANGKKRTLSSSVEDVKPKKSKAPRSDIDLDNEAINSDLDDSDDDAMRADGDEYDEGDVQTVLCLYDKVQRTKNKWKCVLKDGIVSVNGKDFAFNKANGEFEW